MELAAFGLCLPRARRSKTRNSACGFIKRECFANRDLQHGRNDELRNAHAARDREGDLPQIDQNDLYFAAMSRRRWFPAH